MKLFELINPSDPYTFYAASIEIAGIACRVLSGGFGARCLDPDSKESTPLLFGWDEWYADRGIPDAGKFMEDHYAEVADALDSFLIGGANERADVESMLAMIPEEKREQWRAERQNRHRTSMSPIGEVAYENAKRIRAFLAKQQPEASE